MLMKSLACRSFFFPVVVVDDDVDFFGVHVPKGSVMHLCIGAASRDPKRWDRPDEWDLDRPPKASLAFGGGAHICLGMHVARAEMVIKVKEPLPDEWPLLRRGQILFTYFHFAASRPLTDAVLASGITAVAYETLRDDQGRLPLLTRWVLFTGD